MEEKFTSIIPRILDSWAEIDFLNILLTFRLVLQYSSILDTKKL